MIDTEGWILRSGATALAREQITIPDLERDEVLARPLYGCWEGNMTHAIQHSPIDLCRTRAEDYVVIGNAGVCEVLETGGGVTNLAPGDRCIVFCNGKADRFGYPLSILGYDAPGTMGVLARRSKFHETQLIRIPADSKHTLQQWAAFSLRYITAWANWSVAYACWRSQMDEAPERMLVAAWGGGVAFAELCLARLFGCGTAMVTSRDSRARSLERAGIEPILRSASGGIAFERQLLGTVGHLSGGLGASIFVDNIGSHFELTIQALARQGVIATSGWKRRVAFPLLRSAACISRHLYVHTHYASYKEGVAAVEFGEKKGWMPPRIEGEAEYSWDDIPQLCADYSSGSIDSYFPVFKIQSP